MPVRFGYAIVYVPDVETTIAFWERAFDLKRRMVLEGEYGELETGDTRLAFAIESLAATHGFTVRPNKPGETPAGFEVALVADDVQAAFARATAAGAKPISEPEQKPWGQTVAYVRDLNGILVELCSPMD
jgi:catechol 2,3-dioxygenase-like lactoylglutathione lyase family enzyme